MRYRFKNYEIRSENAAKPASQVSAYLVKLLPQFGRVSRALDFGCGKLRYAVHLQKLAARLTLADSEVQLSRVQVLFDTPTTIRQFVRRKWTNTRVLSECEWPTDRGRYDFILCANVLSAIPRHRVRLDVVRVLASRLTTTGKCLFVCQHNNSYFRSQMADPNVVKFADGFIKGSIQNASFYGIIPPADLRSLVTKAGMVIERSWVNDQSGYIIGVRK
jgi:hypothetical protein